MKINKMINLILPCAGKSSRFPGKPKWLLTCPNGNLMIQESLSCLDLTDVNNIFITFVKEHIDKYFPRGNIYDLFKKYKNLKITILENFTQSQTETVYLTIKKNNIQGAIFIKDCDSYYNYKIKKGNYACSLIVNEKNNVSTLYNKSFIEKNALNQIINFCEKKIISNIICVGGYSFENSKLFIDFYEKCKDIQLNTKEFHISHLIHFCLLENEIFYSEEIENFIEWGTPSEWKNYKDSFSTLFLDIDGTIFKNSGQYSVPSWGYSEPLKENLEVIKNLYNKGRTQIILTTARKKEFEEITKTQLKKYNVPYDDIIFGLLHSKRILINDYSDTNPYPSSISINIKRDSNELKNLLF